MIDRFMAFERCACIAHNQIHKINANRTTLKGNSMICLIVPSFRFAQPPNDRGSPIRLLYIAPYDPYIYEFMVILLRIILLDTAVHKMAIVDVLPEQLAAFQHQLRLGKAG
jgi:hypothetical protein